MSFQRRPESNKPTIVDSVDKGEWTAVDNDRKRSFKLQSHGFGVGAFRRAMQIGGGRGERERRRHE